MSDSRVDLVRQALFMPSTENLKLMTLQVRIRSMLQRKQEPTEKQLDLLLEVAGLNQDSSEKRVPCPLGSEIFFEAVCEKRHTIRRGERMVLRVDRPNDAGEVETFRLSTVYIPKAMKHIQEGDRVELTCTIDPSDDPSMGYFKKVEGVSRIIERVAKTG